MRTSRNLPGIMLNLPQVMNELFNDDLMQFTRQNSNTSKPALNIIENNEAYTVELAVPGFSKDQFEIKIEKNILKISAQATEENAENKPNYTYREFRNLGFTRTIQLPENKIEESAISAQYSNGILMISLPKKEETKQLAAKVIEIA